MGRKVLLYINQINLDELSGQASFERGLLTALRNKLTRDPTVDLRIFSVHDPRGGTKAPLAGDDVRTLPLSKRGTWSYVAFQWSLFWALGRELWQRRGNDLTLYVRYSPSMIAPALLALLFRRRLVFRTGPVFRSLQAYRTDIPRGVYPVLGIGLWLFCRQAHRIVVITKQVADWVSLQHPFARDKITIVPNGADPEKFLPLPPDRGRWGLPENAFVMGYVGYIDEYQGLHVIIRAMANIRKRSKRVPHLLVVGDGPSRKQWEDLAFALGISDLIVWAGRLPHDEVPHAIAACDAMLLPLTQRSIETRGTSATKLFEYLACDKFVLASRCEDLLFLDHEAVGRLVNPEDEDEWTEALLEQMDVPRDGLEGRGRALVMKKYSFDVVAEKIWSVCFG